MTTMITKDGVVYTDTAVEVEDINASKPALTAASKFAGINPPLVVNGIEYTNYTYKGAINCFDGAQIKKGIIPEDKDLQPSSSGIILFTNENGDILERSIPAIHLLDTYTINGFKIYNPADRELAILRLMHWAKLPVDVDVIMGVANYVNGDNRNSLRYNKIESGIITTHIAPKFDLLAIEEDLISALNDIDITMSSFAPGFYETLASDGFVYSSDTDDQSDTLVPLELTLNGDLITHASVPINEICGSAFKKAKLASGFFNFDLLKSYNAGFTERAVNTPGRVLAAMAIGEGLRLPKNITRWDKDCQPEILPTEHFMADIKKEIMVILKKCPN